MKKIEVEDLTEEGRRERNILDLANGLVQAAGRSGPGLGLTLKHSAIALFAAAEITLMIGRIEDDEVPQIRKAAVKYAQQRKEELRKSGIMDIIQAVKKASDKSQGEDDE